MLDYALPALIGGIAGILAAALPIYFANKKLPSRRTTDQIAAVGASDKVIDILREEIVRLEAKNSRLERRNDELEEELDKLRSK
jgi:cell division protein FtsB